MSFIEILSKGFKDIIEKLIELIELLGGAKKELRDFKPPREWDEWRRRERGRRGGEGIRGGQFGIPYLPQDALIQAHRGESILPKSLTDALREFYSGQSAQVSPVEAEGGRLVAIISIDGRQFYKAVVPYIKEGVKHGDYEEGEY